MSGLSLFLVVAVVFVAAFAAAGTLYGALLSRQAAKRDLLARRLGTLGQGGQSIFKVDRHDPLADLLGPAGDRLEHLLLEAGESGAVRWLVFRMVLIGVVSAGLGFAAVGPAGLPFLLVGLLPWVALRSRAHRRSVELSEQLPDALDLTARTLRAGHALSDALRACATELPPPIAAELGRVYEEHRLGRDLRDALMHMADRNASNFDLRLVVSCLLLQRKTGGNLVELLDNIATTVRARFVFDAKVRALTAEARLSASVLAVLPFLIAFAILLMRPSYLAPLVTESVGVWLLSVAALGFAAGMVLLRNLTQVEV
jgi:tight adherence protein B